MWNWARLAVLVYPKSSQGFLHTFSMALYHKWDVKKCLCLCTSILSLIFGGLRGVHNHRALSSIWKKIWGPNVLLLLNHKKKVYIDRISIYFPGVVGPIPRYEFTFRWKVCVHFWQAFQSVTWGELQRLVSRYQIRHL